MGILDKNPLEDDDSLPGGSGLHLDLETKVCPECGREALPWQTTCEDCGVVTVLRRDVPVEEFALPHLVADEPDADPDEGEDADPDEQR